MNRPLLVVVRVLAAAAAGIAALSLSGCSGAGAGSVVLEIVAEVDTISTESDSAVLVVVTDGNNLVTDATVTVNGEAIPLFFFFYSGYITKVNAGETVNLTVTTGGSSASASITMPSQPVITAPGNGTSHDETSAISVTWNAATPAPDQYVLSAGDDVTTTAEEEYTANLCRLTGKHSREYA